MKILDKKNEIGEIDPQDFYHSIIHMPEQVQQAYFQAEFIKPKNFHKEKSLEIKRVLLCGMGGSAISGDLIQAAFSHILPVDVVKDYWPPYIDAHTLVIACSYSGNTEETLNCFKEAKKHTENIAAVTTGGKLEKLVDGKDPYVKLPKGFQPRAAIGFLFFSILKIIEEYEIVPDSTNEVKSIIAKLSTKAASLCIAKETKMNIAKQSAEKINGKIPIIYSVSPSLNPIALRWKCQINENSKYPAFSNTFPEMNHNEIEGWENPDFQKKFIPIFLDNFNQDENYKKRTKIFKKLMNKNEIEYLEFFAEGETLIEEFFTLIYLGDMISYYLAILNEVDPSKIDFIKFLKSNI